MAEVTYSTITGFLAAVAIKFVSKLQKEQLNCHKWSYKDYLVWGLLAKAIVKALDGIRFMLS